MNDAQAIALGQFFEDTKYEKDLKVKRLIIDDVSMTESQFSQILTGLIAQGVNL